MEHSACVSEQPRTDNLAWRSTKGQKIRATYLAEYPYCRDCSTQFGNRVPATEVHHLVPQIDRPDLVFEWSNLIALCHSCHNNRHGKGIGVSKGAHLAGRPFALLHFMSCYSGG